MKEILEFQVRLAEISPAVWRRFELRAEGTFWHLHCTLHAYSGESGQPFRLRHIVMFEGRRPAVAGERYPRCTGGERLCPPEDVGGSTGYVDFLEGLADRRHERHKEYARWIGGSFDLEELRLEMVRFSKPGARLRRLLE